jgi:hypothetical protein
MPQTFVVNQVRLALFFLIAAFQVLDTEDTHKSIRGTWINFGYGILSQQIIQPSYDSNLFSQVTFILASIFIIGISNMMIEATFARIDERASVTLDCNAEPGSLLAEISD